MALIGGSVGAGGKNESRDVKVVQRLLNKHSLPPLRDLTVDGKAGPNTIDAIRHFQSVVVKMRSPDGRVDPGGKTIRRLNHGADDSRSAPNGTTPQGGGARGGGSNTNLSGTRWWRANQARYPNSRRLDDLEGDFGGKVTRFVNAIKEGGANVSVGSTLRNKIRAHLMHYSWRVANKDIAPDRVPQIAGLNIQWDHGNLDASRKAARQMVRLFNMAYIASTTSNHISGQAIDMTITWKGTLAVKVPGREQAEIVTGPRNGKKNRQLHRLGREFGIKKLLKDAPHWSHNGR